MRITMRVTDPASIEHDVVLPRCWKIDRNETVDGFPIYDDYFCLSSGGVRTHIRRRQPAHSGDIEYALRTEFRTNWWKRSSGFDQEFFGLSRVVVAEEISKGDFEAIEAELRSHVEAQQRIAMAEIDDVGGPKP